MGPQAAGVWFTYHTRAQREVFESESILIEKENNTTRRKDLVNQAEDDWKLARVQRSQRD